MKYHTWSIYQGKNYTPSPIGIKLNSNLHINVFMTCEGLTYNRNAPGELSGKRLLTVYENPEASAV